VELEAPKEEFIMTMLYGLPFVIGISFYFGFQFGKKSMRKRMLKVLQIPPGHEIRSIGYKKNEED